MEKKNLKWDYDEENDTLFFYTDEEYKSSVIFFGIIIDISKNRKVKGLEILDASKVFSELIGSEITKDMLNHVSKPKITTKPIRDLLIVELDFKAENTKIFLPLSINNPSFALT